MYTASSSEERLNNTSEKDN